MEPEPTRDDMPCERAIREFRSIASRIDRLRLDLERIERSLVEVLRKMPKKQGAAAEPEEYPS